MIKTLFFNIAIIAILLIPLEYFSGKMYKSNKNKSGYHAVNVLLKESSDSLKSILSHPYMLYVNNPNYHEDGKKKHNKHGYRNKNFEIKENRGLYRILALGGSTTYGFGNKDTKKTWPAVLEKKMNIFDKKSLVINAGLNYATSAEILASYVFRHKYLNPNLIIYHGGGNDISPVFFPNYSSEYSHFRAHGKTPAYRRGDKFLLKFNFFRLIYSLRLNNISSVYQPQPYGFDKLDAEEVKLRVDNKNNYSGFTRNIESLIKYSKANGSKIIIVGFLIPSEEKIVKSRPGLAHLSKELILATNNNNEILRDISQKHNILFIDFEEYSFEDSLFIDNCHLNPIGEELKAEIIYQNIINNFKD